MPVFALSLMNITMVMILAYGGLPTIPFFGFETVLNQALIGCNILLILAKTPLALTTLISAALIAFFLKGHCYIDQRLKLSRIMLSL